MVGVVVIRFTGSIIPDTTKTAKLWLESLWALRNAVSTTVKYSRPVPHLSLMSASRVRMFLHPYNELFILSQCCTVLATRKVSNHPYHQLQRVGPVAAVGTLLLLAVLRACRHFLPRWADLCSKATATGAASTKITVQTAPVESEALAPRGLKPQSQNTLVPDPRGRWGYLRAKSSFFALLFRSQAWVCSKVGESGSDLAV